MKSIIKIAFILIIPIAIAFSSCKKDRDMTLVLTVKSMADTMVVVPNAKVNLNKDDIYISGFTDGNGQFRHSFQIPMQLDIVVTKDTLKGLGSVNVNGYGETTEKNIYLF